MATGAAGTVGGGSCGWGAKAALNGMGSAMPAMPAMPPPGRQP